MVHRSLPSRGAWIEIEPGSGGYLGGHVAPLTGSVDRNPAGTPDAWWYIVAPLTGSVDRNNDLTEIQKQQALRRSPHGERG